MLSASATKVAMIEVFEVAVNTQVERSKTDEFSVSSMSDRMDVTARHGDQHALTGMIMSRKIKTIFALAIIAMALSLSGQAQLLGLSPRHGFTGAVIVLTLAVVIALSQLRENLRPSQ